MRRKQGLSSIARRKWEDESEERRQRRGMGDGGVKGGSGAPTGVGNNDEHPAGRNQK
jgi:hypothetical protein